MRFGEYLVSKGVLGEPELLEAHRAQRVYGGRIGTNLVERGSLVLDDLAAQLAAWHGVELPPHAWLERPDPRARALVPMALVRRFHVLPLRLEQRLLHVTMLDPADRTQLDFLAQAAGRPIAPSVLPEVRLLYWLEKHCGIDRHPRYVNLSARARTPAPADAGPADAAAFGPLGEDEELTPPEAAAFDPAVWATADAADVEELLLEDIALPGEPGDVAPRRRATDPPPGTPPAPATPAEVAALEAQLEAAADREQAIALALRIALAYARCAVLLVVRAGHVMAHRAAGDGVAPRPGGVLLPLETPSLFARPAVDGLRFRGQPPHDGIDGRVLDALGRPHVHEVLIEPVSIRGRVVNLLYADNGADAHADTSVAALAALGATLARAYERMILETKRQR